MQLIKKYIILTTQTLYHCKGNLHISDTGSCHIHSRVLQTVLGCSIHRFHIPCSLHGLNKALSCLGLYTGL